MVAARALRVLVLCVVSLHALQVAPTRRCPPRLRGPRFARATDEAPAPPSPGSVALLAVVPALSAVFPVLLSQLPPGGGPGAVLPLLLYKRLYVYSAAAVVVAVGGARGAEDPARLGTRVEALTAALLPARPTDTDAPASRGAPFRELRRLDAVDETAAAVAVPVFAASSLFVSLLLVRFAGGAADAGGGAAADAAGAVASATAVSNAVALGAFSRVEAASALAFLGQGAADAAGAAVAVGLVAAAYGLPGAVSWPAQNCLCMCLGVGVARALHVPRLAPLLLAAAGLACYDALALLPTLASAAPVDASPMGAVAASRALSGGAFQPGALVVRVGGRVTDVLGLGDCVFPALVAGFARRYDNAREGAPYFGAALGGYGAGCVACEFYPGINEGGAPALVVLLPAMIAAVLATGAARGDLDDLFAFAPEGDGADSDA